ncbi:MAG: RagB/SusD family nutrient uptake outer membrane protein [Bacteroidia bacterium]|nr:RagB/SusD family nutrient uptake outer membrane protein [Bacteroidia bacterium]
MKLSFKYLTIILLGMSVFMTSCFNDLNVIPLDEDEVTSAVVYDDPAAYRQVLAKLYAGYALSGQEGPSGQPDISGIDEGFSTYLRQYWKAQELSTDEAVIAWNDGNIHDFHQQDWNSSNEFITAMYNRIFYQISLVNEYLRETTDEKLDSRNVDAATRADVAEYRTEARFLRALSYWHALDLFRNVPFVTEEDAVGSFFPEQINESDLFAFIEAELLEIESQMVGPRQNEYGRADQAAAWTLLAKLYLNAEVYTGQAKYTECVTYCRRVMDAGYTLEPEYKNLFLADNHQSDEIIFPINFDGLRSKTWGGMTFMVHAAVGGGMSPSEYGIDGGWGGIRTTSAIVDKFPAVGTGSVIVAPSEGNTASYPKIYVPGGYQGWDPANTATVMTSVASDDKYEGYFWFDANTEFKFTTGPNWDVNYGDTGADGTLDSGGDNLKVADAGFYKLNVDIAALTYTISKTTWGLIGSATADGWNSDQDMTYNATEGAWVITADLIAGEVKFRANDDWGLNYGDDGANAILEINGGNIAIPSAGTYQIKLYLDRPDYTYSVELTSFDRRALFYTEGQSKEIEDISQFTQGYAITKYKNVTSTGAPGSDPTFVDTDFPMFRLADVYLMYAEAILRGGAGGSTSDALDRVNEIRERAYDGPSGNIETSDLTLDFILDERARELVWECHRRTDLVRFSKFSNSSYLWPWKGGVAEGKSVSEIYDVYPIPASDITANPNLTQNTGY